MIFKKLLNLLHTPKWLFIILVAVVILRIPSFFEPYSYGDEMIYLTLGEGIRQGVPLYKELHDNKPPLLYVTAAVAGSLFWFKAILALWHLVTIFIFWRLSVALFPKKDKLHKVATIIFSLFTTIPLLEGNIVNAELFMIGPIMAAFLILLGVPNTASPKKIYKKLLLAGVLFSIATLYKVPAAFDMVTIVFLWIVVAGKFKGKAIKEIVQKTVYLTLGFLAPILLTIVWYATRGALNEYLIAAFLQNIGYLSTFRPGDVAEPFLVKNGPMLIRAGIATAGFVILYQVRKRLSKQFIFLTAWLLLTLFAVTLSERPYPHYLIQSVAPASLLLAILFTQKTIEQSLVIIPLTLTFFVPVYFKFWYYPTTSYYTRFVKFAGGLMNREDYLSTYGGQVLRNYKIADYLVASTQKKDKVFIWGDGVPIYALSRRLPPTKYVADYHIRDFSSKEETLSIVSSSMPKMIVVLPNSEPFPELLLFLRKNYILVDNIDSAQLWTVLSPRVRALIAT